MARILVTDGDQRAALAIVRSLGSAGHEVIVTSPDGHSLAGASRFAAADIALPHPLSDPNGFFEEITAHASRTDVLVPVTEPSLLAVLPRVETLPCTVPFPDADTFQRASDKAWVAEAAAAVGLAVPRQLVIESHDVVPDLPVAESESWVLKPSRSVTGGLKLSVSYARGGNGLLKAIGSLAPQAFPLLVQQRVEGPGAGVFLLRWKGRILAAFAHRRIREKPPSGGVSVLRESVRLDPRLLEGATKLLERLDWKGVAMVEFKVDARSGTGYVMEVNGRFWGSLQLAVDAGVDFPRLLVDAALGHDVRPVTDYRVGVRSRWLLGDVDHMLLRLRRSRQALNLPPGAPGRGTVLADFFKTFVQRHRTEVLRLSDPHPFMREFARWLGQLLQRR